MSWSMLYESFGHYVAVVLGCITYRRLKLFHKLMFFQVLMALPFYVMFYAVIRYQKAHGLELNNLWVHNLYILAEGLVLAAGAFVRCRSIFEKRCLGLLCIGFVLVMIIEHLLTPERVMYTYGFYAKSLLVILSYSYLLYRLLHEHQGPVSKLPDLWIFLGLLLYFTADAPY